MTGVVEERELSAGALRMGDEIEWEGAAALVTRCQPIDELMMVELWFRGGFEHQCVFLPRDDAVRRSS